MRVLKLAATGLIAYGLFVVWTNLDWVERAYTEDPAPIDFSSDGIDLTFERTEIGPSPFAFVALERGPSVELHWLPSAPPPTVAIRGGRSSLYGDVTGPEGPLPGATVVVERHTTGGKAVERLYADEFGHWELAGILGGRYRVRAFVPNEFRSVSSGVTLLAAGASMDMSMSLSAFAPATDLSLVGGVTSYPGGVQTLAVVVSVTRVADEGRVLTVPVASTPVVVSVAGTSQLITSSSVLTDSGGAARYSIRCDRPGGVTVTATSELITRSFAIPDCIPEPPPEPELTVTESTGEDQ